MSLQLFPTDYISVEQLKVYGSDCYVLTKELLALRIQRYSMDNYSIYYILTQKMWLPLVS